jgi:adenosine deaminase
MVWVKSISLVTTFIIFTVVGNISETTQSREVASVCNNLDSKLANVFSLYRNAQDKIIERVTKDRSSMTRSEWERLLAPSSECKITGKDERDLKKRHSEIITKSKKDAIQNSVIDISKVKEMNVVEKFCKELPKGGVLHLHPSGILDRSTIKSLGDYSTEKYFLDPGQNTFESFDSLFSPLRRLLGRGLTQKLKKGIESYLNRASKEGVIYVEFGKLFTASTSTDNQLENWAEEFYRKYGVVVKWKAGFVRVHGNGNIQSQVSSLFENEYRHRRNTKENGFKHIVGVDLYGNEKGNSALVKGQSIYGPLFAMKTNQHFKGWRTKLRTTIHAGEIGDARNPRDAMIMGVDRIGHGVSLKERPIDLEYARIYNNGVGLPIEINLVSNYRLSAINSYKEHPFLDFLRLGLPVSLSTDDEGIFETTISTECEKAIKYFDIEYSEFKKMSYNSIKHSFADQETKDSLEANLDQMYSRFEQDWSRQYGK